LGLALGIGGNPLVLDDCGADIENALCATRRQAKRGGVDGSGDAGLIRRRGAARRRRDDGQKEQDKRGIAREAACACCRAWA
jgi:hypothetical protein